MGNKKWTLNVIREAQKEKRLCPITPEELKREDEELLRYGEAQAKKLGIKGKDVPRLVRERRAARRGERSQDMGKNK